ncbi:hypothetical protein HanRHA438_Chr10g0478121 [Helianthus annuus]|nr:hypothetical protein HanRHA438_Chr10g0478121 [Helianthus annuus]
MYILLICFVFSRFLQQKEQIRGKIWAGEGLAHKPRRRELKRSEKYIPGASRRPAWALKHFQAARITLKWEKLNYLSSGGPPELKVTTKRAASHV